MKLIRVFLSLIFILTFNLFNCSLVEAKDITIVLDGRVKQYNPGPILMKGKTLVPIRGVFSSLGATVNWDKKTQTISAEGMGQKIVLPVQSDSALVNQEQVKLEVPAQIVKGTTFVPLRFVSEALGAKVEWESETRTIYIFQGSNQLSIGEIAKEEKSVVQIRTYDKDGRVLGTGSGFLVESDGQILTNYHVLAHASRADVVLHDGKKLSVSGILSYNVDRDVALIKVEGKELPFVKLGNSKELKLGDRVVAIGSPIGLQNTITDGIISPIRKLTGQNYLQFSAAISSGSSGGALFNGKGQVIGITTATIIQGRDLNLAIPIDEVKPLLVTNSLKSFDIVTEEIEKLAKQRETEITEKLTFKYGKGIIGDESFVLQEAYLEYDFTVIYVDLILDRENFLKVKALAEEDRFLAEEYLGKVLKDLEVWSNYKDIDAAIVYYDRIEDRTETLVLFNNYSFPPDYSFEW